MKNPTRALPLWWSKRGRWSKRFLIGIPVAILLYTLIGFFGIPLLLRTIVRGQFEKDLNGTISVASVQCNPWTFSLGVDQLDVRDSAGDRVLGFERFEANLEFWRTLFRAGTHVQFLRVSEPFVHAAISRDAVLNLAALIKPDPEPSAPKPLESIPHIVIDELTMVDGAAKVDDATLPEHFAFAVSGVRFTLNNLDTAPEKDNNHSLLATTDTGARIEWTGTLRSDPLSSRGRFVATDLLMPRFMPYAMRFTDARVVDGRLSCTIDYDFDPVRTPRVAQIDFPTIEIVDLTIDRGGAPLARLPRLTVERVTIDADTRAVSIARIAVTDGSLAVERGPDGNMNLAEMLIVPEEALAALPAPGSDGASATAPLTSAEEEEAAAVGAGARVDPRTIPYPLRQLITAISYLVQDVVGPWDVAVERLEIANQAVDLTDRVPIPAVEIPVRGLSLTAGPLRSSERFRVPFESALRIGDSEKGGRIASSGILGVGERTVDATLRIEALELTPTSPYLAMTLSPPLTRPALRSASFSLDGRFEASTPNANTGTAHWSGSMLLEGAELEQSPATESDAPIDMAGAARISVKGDVRIAASATEGERVDTIGAVSIEGIEGSAPLLSALGLGPGSFSAETVGLEGTFTATRMLGDEPRIGWAGTLSIGEAEIIDIDADGTPLSAGAGMLSLVGKVDAIVPTVGGATLNWEGSLELARGRGELAGRDADGASFEAAAEAEEVGLTGALEGTIDGAGATSVTWRGELNTSRPSLALRGGASPVDVTVDSASIDGGATAQLVGGAASVDWAGRLMASRVASTVASVERPLHAEIDSLEADGATHAEQSPDGAWNGRWQGTLGIGSTHAEVRDGDATLDCTVDQTSIDGLLEATADSHALPRLSWDGQAALSDAAVNDSRQSAPLVAASAIAVLGRASASLEAGSRGGTWKGMVSIDEASAGIRRTNGGLDGSLDRLELDGELASSAASADLTSLHWLGSAIISDAKAESTGGVPLSVTAAQVTSGAALDLLLGGDTTRLAWDGPLRLVSAAARRAVLDTASGQLELIGRGAFADSGAEFVGTLDGAALQLSMPGDGGGPSTTTLRAAHVDVLRFAGASVETLAFEGSATLEGLLSGLGATGLTANSEGVALRGIDYSGQQQVLSIEQLVITAPGLTGEMSLVNNAASAGEPAAAGAAESDMSRDPAPPAGDDAVPPRVRGSLAGLLPIALRVKEFRLTDGRIEITDPVAEPPTTILIDEISAEVADIESGGSTMASINLTSRLQSSGRFEMTGKADLFRRLPSADLLFTVTGAPLPPYSAFSGKYAGYRIDDGRLSTTIPVVLDEGTASGDIEFLLDHLTLGAKTDSPDAPKIPLELGLALLRDQNNQIKGNVSFSGDMTEPSFTLAGLIWRAMLSLLGKIVTAPFQLIAAAFGGGEDLDLSYIDFEPGSSELTAEALTKIDILARGLIERPNVRLAIAGQFTREADTTALRPGLLRERVKEQLRQSFPTLEVVGADLYRQVVVSMHAALPVEQRAGGAPAPGAAAPEPSFDEIEEAVLRTIPVTDEMLRALAQQRAERVAEVVIVEKLVPAERVEASAPEGDGAEFESPRAAFEIK